MLIFDAKALGERIIRKRLELGMLQKDFAKSVDLSVSFYGHIERGTRVPSLPTLVLIANKLKVGCDELLRDSLVAPCLPLRNMSNRNISYFREFLQERDISLEDWFADVQREEEETAAPEATAEDREE